MEGEYDAHIARGGTNVSGGQKQRLAIARAIARNPEIYIFDDMRRVVPFELVEHVADGDVFPIFHSGGPRRRLRPDASGLQRPDFLQSRSPGCTPAARSGRARSAVLIGFINVGLCCFRIFPAWCVLCGQI